MNTWTPEQRRLLDAMGYTLMQRSGPREAMPAGSTALPATASAAGSFDRLRDALLRASAGRDISGLVADIDSLRRDPKQKRALWPQLRALRRS